MRRKGFAVLAAAAVLSMGVMTISAYAAEGWAMQNNSWVYLDKNGNKLKNEWKKGADNLWRYLNSKGEMAISTWADDEYYVDSNGIMVTNQWVKTTPRWDNTEEAVWYYFGSTGKMVEDGWKKIDGKNYLFDSDGVMQTGWSEDGLYYLGTDGAMKTGWKYLAPAEGEEENNYRETSSDGMYWYYFSSNGKKYCPETGDDDGEYRISRINGEYYCFDETGKMQTGWVYLLGDPEHAPGNSIENWRYFAEPEITNLTTGASVKGWLSLIPPEELSDNMDDPVVWYYFEKDGTPKTGPEYGDASTDDFVRISGKSYLFDPKGNPVSGLHKVYIGDTDEYTAYYFDEDSKTAIKGKETVEEGDGTVSTFYFNEGSYAGRGVTGVKDGYLYYMGKRQEANEEAKYEAITIETGKTYVVNKNGKIVKNKSVKDDDGTKYTVDKNGLLTKVDDEAVGSQKFNEPIEPEFSEWDW